MGGTREGPDRHVYPILARAELAASPTRRVVRRAHARRGRLRGMRVYLGCDHAGFELKNHLMGWLVDNGYEPVDCGPSTYVDDDDYPPYIIDTSLRVIADYGSLGVVIGGSGNGEQI